MQNWVRNWDRLEVYIAPNPNPNPYPYTKREITTTRKISYECNLTKKHGCVCIWLGANPDIYASCINKQHCTVSRRRRRRRKSAKRTSAAIATYLERATISIRGSAAENASLEFAFFVHTVIYHNTSTRATPIPCSAPRACMFRVKSFRATFRLYSVLLLIHIQQTLYSLDISTVALF